MEDLKGFWVAILPVGKKFVKTVIADVFYNTYQKTSFNISNLLIRAKTTKTTSVLFLRNISLHLHI